MTPHADLLNALITIDGGLFTLIALVVLVTPSPQPALTRPVDEDALGPFKETRRLLAGMFLGSGALLLVIGLGVTDHAVLRRVAAARVATFALVAAVNVAQLRGGRWKRGPLLGLLVAWTVLGGCYVWAGL